MSDAERPPSLFNEDERAEQLETGSEPEIVAGQEQTQEPTLPVATPFVKWVGGKRNLMDVLLSHLPDRFNNYYEPFVGGGALFFELARRGRLQKAHLCDKNLDLVITYKVIQQDPDRLLEMLRTHAEHHSSDYYYEVRSQHHLQDPVEIAARFLYLNKTCYNGLWRVNRKGEFNVPVGRYKNPGIVQEDNLRACHAALALATVQYQEFDRVSPKVDDFVYFDPPYHPTDEASFTSYSQSGFGDQDQVRLRDFALKLHKGGAKVMLSNSDTQFIRDLYSSNVFNVMTVQAPRFVNCKPTKRGDVNELLITNY